MQEISKWYFVIDRINDFMNDLYYFTIEKYTFNFSPSFSEHFFFFRINVQTERPYQLIMNL